MMHQRAIRAAAACILLGSLLSACGGGGSSRTGAAHSSVIPASGPQPSATFAYDARTVSNAQLIGPAQFKTLSLDVIPKLRDANGLLAYAQSVSDTHSGAYRRFLTPAQIGDRFGAAQPDYDGAKKYLASHGLTVDGWPQRLLLHVSGSQANLEAAFGTHFGWYKSTKGAAFLAPMQAPKVAAGVPIVGSTNIVRAVSASVDSFRITTAGQTNGAMYGYTPQEVAAAFDYNGAYRDGYTGAGITVGVIGTAGFSPADVPAYKALFHVPGTSNATMVVATDADAPGNGATGFATPPPLTHPCLGNPISPHPWCNPEDGETQLDTEQIAGLAYDSAVKYYLAYNPNDGCGAVGVPCPDGAGIPLQGLGEVDAELQTAIADNSSDVLSLSFGGPEAGMVGGPFNANGYGFEPLEFAALASEGIAIFVSSGDAGAEECQRPFYQPAADSLCVAYPSTDPSVVSVGGVNTPLDSAGRLVGPLTGWGNTTTAGVGGSGGGVSAYFPMPAYQQGAAGVSGSMRNVPDISLNADAYTGVATMLNADPALGGRSIFSFGGTSAAAPESAAMWALVLQACKATATCATAGGNHPYRLGNPAQYFYKIYRNASQYKDTFYDVLYGDNSQENTCWRFGPTPPPDPNATPGPCPTPSMDPGYQAQTGYDLVTGLGVPYARALIHAVVGV